MVFFLHYRGFQSTISRCAKLCAKICGPWRLWPFFSSLALSRSPFLLLERLTLRSLNVIIRQLFGSTNWWKWMSRAIMIAASIAMHCKEFNIQWVIMKIQPIEIFKWNLRKYVFFSNICLFVNGCEKVSLEFAYLGSKCRK